MIIHAILSIITNGIIMFNGIDYKFKISASGRINVIGEHVDYCGGKVFPAAISLKNDVYIRPNGTNRINLSWTTLNETVSLDIDKLDSYRGLKYGNYQAGAACFLKRAGFTISGCDILSDCKIPFGSGLSSSAAIEVSTIKALLTLSGEYLSDVDIAILAQKVEREYVGVNCGIMDQYASACGKRDSALILDCKTLECEYVPFNLKNCSLLIANCNKPHNLIESKYNERRTEVERALDILKNKFDISCLADLTTEDFFSTEFLLDDTLKKRARHVVCECERVNLAKEAMISGNLKELGRLLNASHASLRDLYEVTGSELDALQKAASENQYCLGSRMSGGGFGGCTISLVLADKIDVFKQTVIEKYEKEIGYSPTFYDVDISDGITVELL